MVSALVGLAYAQLITLVMNASHPRLLSPYTLGNLSLKNRIVMAPMTRSRAIGYLPNALMVDYYRDRADAGLIITEGTAPSPNGLGYPRIPGVYSEEQMTGWKAVTDAVHANGGLIFVQLMHTGRIAHPLNMPDGAEVVGPSPIAATVTRMYTDQQAMQPLPVPKAIPVDEIGATIAEFVHSAQTAIRAGFDGVEIHGANGYLLHQFLSPAANQRTDGYGRELRKPEPLRAQPHPGRSRWYWPRAGGYPAVALQHLQRHGRRYAGDSTIYGLRCGPEDHWCRVRSPDIG